MLFDNKIINIRAKFIIYVRMSPQKLEEGAKKNIRRAQTRVAQLVRTVSQNTKVVGSIPSQGTYKNQLVNA